MFRWRKIFRNPADIVFRTGRYEKTVTVPKGFLSDGATGVSELGKGFFIHDWLFFAGRFDDGSRCEFEQANRIYEDYLRTTGYSIRAWFRYVGTTYLPVSRSAWQNHRKREMMWFNRKFIYMAEKMNHANAGKEIEERVAKIKSKERR